MSGSRGGTATLILRAIMAGEEFPPDGVADTPHNRQVWDSMKQEAGSIPSGDVVDIPHDWTDA